MPLQPIDMQTNFANIATASKMAKQAQVGAERQQVVHGAKLLEEMSKEIERKLVKTNETSENQKLEEDTQNLEEHISENEGDRSPELVQNSSEKIETNHLDHPFKGKFVDFCG